MVELATIREIQSLWHQFQVQQIRICCLVEIWLVDRLLQRPPYLVTQMSWHAKKRACEPDQPPSINVFLSQSISLTTFHKRRRILVYNQASSNKFRVWLGSWENSKRYQLVSKKLSSTSVSDSQIWVVVISKHWKEKVRVPNVTRIEKNWLALKRLLWKLKVCFCSSRDKV